MHFDNGHQKYGLKVVERVEGVYISTGRRRQPYLGSFTINYIEFYLDEDSYICDLGGLVGNPRRENENLALPPQQRGNFLFPGEANKVPAKFSNYSSIT